MSRFSLRITTSSTRWRIAGFISWVRLKRTGSSISNKPVKERVWPFVRRGREKKAVLEPGAQEAEGLAELAVFAERRRHEVVALVHDQQVPREMGRSLGCRAGRKELFPYVRLPEVVV